MRPRPITIYAGAVLVAISAACSGGGGAEEQTAAQDTQSAVPASAPSGDSAMAGMDHGPARDAEQEFLRMMVDHHQGLIVMAQQAMERGSTDSLKAEAHELHTKQETEQREMLGMLQSQYNDTHSPSVMPSNQAMNDSLSAQQGANYDMTFRMNVVRHHREGIQMIDRFLPRFTKPEVRSMAERMKADQQRDIQKLEAEMGHGA